MKRLLCFIDHKIYKDSINIIDFIASVYVLFDNSWCVSQRHKSTLGEQSANRCERWPNDWLLYLEYTYTLSENINFGQMLVLCW